MSQTVRDKSRLLLVLCVLLMTPTVASAHGEEVLIFPISAAILFVPALAVCVVRWHSFGWVRLVTALVFLGTNVFLWFSPVFPRTIGAFAGYNLGHAIAILLIVPTVAAIVTGLLLKRFVPGRSG